MPDASALNPAGVSMAGCGSHWRSRGEETRRTATQRLRDVRPTLGRQAQAHMHAQHTLTAHIPGPKSRGHGCTMGSLSSLHLPFSIGHTVRSRFQSTTTHIFHEAAGSARADQLPCVGVAYSIVLSIGLMLIILNSMAI